MYLGAHVKSSGGVWKAIEEGARLDCEAIQIFAGSPRTWKVQTYKDADAARFRTTRAASAIRFIVIHTIYLINLGTSRTDFYEKSVAALVGAVTAAEQLGCEAIVTHIGSHGGDGFDAGLARVQKALRAALDEVGDTGVRVLLENTAGAGGTMGVSFEELAAMIDSVDGDPRVGVCLDTAHLFEAGYDLRTPTGVDEALEALDEACGLERLVMLHLNDSKTPLGSNRDRHENIGHGELGAGAFAALLAHPSLDELPGIIEVPGLDGDGPDEANMEALRSLQARR
jgi:deoxyribonuclease IV